MVSKTSEKDLEQFIELLYPFFEKKLIANGLLKNVVRRKNATVTSTLDSGATNIGGNVDVAFPYDRATFSVRNETGANLNQGDLICIEYSVDLKNAIAVYKVN